MSTASVANPRAAATLARHTATLKGDIDKLDDVHLDAYVREKAGEVVSWNYQKGRPHDHVTEVEGAAQGVRNMIRGVDNLLKKGQPNAEQRAQAEELKRQALELLERFNEARTRASQRARR